MIAILNPVQMRLEMSQKYRKKSHGEIKGHPHILTRIITVFGYNHEMN
jgi:hypothetical protein